MLGLLATLLSGSLLCVVNVSKVVVWNYYLISEIINYCSQENDSNRASYIISSEKKISQKTSAY